MTSDVALRDITTTKQEIVHLISSNISAIPLIAEHLNINEELVSSLIRELVEEGKLKGTFSQDGLRFYRSDVKMPTIIEEQIEEVSDNSFKLFIPKALLLSGIGMFIAGEILVRLFEYGSSIYETSTGMVMLGLITIFGGLYSFTKFDNK